jgi:CheY-like chemotaxis protein
MPHLFDPFYVGQAGRQAHGGTGSTGLGLPICREFVHLMGGAIAVESTPGRGSTFRFEVCLSAGEPATAGEGTAPAAPVALRLRPGEPPCRVLVVDDQRDNRILLEGLLGLAGFDVRAAENGLEAVTLCGEWLPRVILMDMRMPVLDGCEATRRIIDAHGAAVRIIALTAGAFAEDRERALAAGAHAFMTKPFREADLLERIRQETGVEYIPVEPLQAGPSPAPPPDVVAAARRLPRDLAAELRDATRRAEYDTMLALVERVAELDDALGCELRGRVERFEYGPLLELLAEEACGV